jgi:hypothetical protein
VRERGRPRAKSGACAVDRELRQALRGEACVDSDATSGDIAVCPGKWKAVTIGGKAVTESFVPSDPTPRSHSVVVRML